MEELPEPNFGDMLRGYRTRRDLTQRELADLCGVSYRAIQQWEGGATKPRERDVVLRLAGQLGLTRAETDKLLMAADFPAEYAPRSLPEPGVVDIDTAKVDRLFVKHFEVEGQTAGDLRAKELAYLADLIAKYHYWAEKYTPLAGIAEVRGATQDGPRLDLPMPFMPAGFEKLEEPGFGERREVKRVPVEDLRDAVAKYRRLVVLGEPGAGKTTALWWLAYDTAVAAQHDPHAPLPLLLPLGAYSGDESLLRYAQNFFGELAPHLPAYLRSGRVVLLLDALNEMPQQGFRERVGRIQALLDEYSETLVVVTCRMLDYEETLQLGKVEVKRLDEDRQLTYLIRYLGEEEGEKLFWKLAGDEVFALWRWWKAEGGTWVEFWTAEQVPWRISYDRSIMDSNLGLWKSLRRGELSPLLALGQNPYMLVMMAYIYVAGEGEFPTNRGELLAKFVAALLAREERRYQKGPWPGSGILRGALSRLAFAMQGAGEFGSDVEYSWAEAQFAEEAADPQQALYLAANATLLEVVGGKVRFVHQIVQEYFAALAWAERIEAGEDLQPYWPRGWIWESGWEETAMLLVGLLPDKTTLVDRLLPVNPGLVARCVAESGKPQRSKSIVDKIQRQLVTLAVGDAWVYERVAAGEALNYLGDPRPGVGLRPDGIPDISWCEVPAGDFIMGNNPDYTRFYFDQEGPQHRERIQDPYLISRYPVTYAQFEAFVRDGGYERRWKGCWTAAGWIWKGHRVGPSWLGKPYVLPNQPVAHVSWYEAHAFCGWLAAKLDLAVALPTEAQWERAARGTDGRRYPWAGDMTPEHAAYSEVILWGTAAVGIFHKGVNPETGVSDMLGNVWEWCRTRWRRNYKHRADDRVEGEADRVLRGGDFLCEGRTMSCAFRIRMRPSDFGWYGFRLVAPCIV